MLLPGNFPFPAVDERERENGAQGGEIPIAMAAGPSAPPPTYPALPRGLKPFVDVVPNSDEDYELQYMHLLRMFWRRSAYYFGERDDEYEARARAGDVSRFGDDARESDDESGEDDAQEGDEDDDDAKNGPMIDERWVRKMSKAFKLGDFKITDERLMPREILEAAFGPESGDGGRKRRAVEPDAAHAPAQKKAKVRRRRWRDQLRGYRDWSAWRGSKRARRLGRTRAAKQTPAAVGNPSRLARAPASRQRTMAKGAKGMMTTPRAWLRTTTMSSIPTTTTGKPWTLTTTTATTTTSVVTTTATPFTSTRLVHDTYDDNKHGALYITIPHTQERAGLPAAHVL